VARPIPQPGKKSHLGHCAALYIYYIHTVYHCAALFITPGVVHPLNHFQNNS
jgi:hypothetical protein